MNRILATSAIALLMGSTAFAADMKVDTVQMDAKTDIFASDLTGMDVYATEENVDANANYGEGATRSWEEVGEVEDVLLTRDGEVKAVIIGVGGFLDMGDRDVAVSMDELHMVDREEQDGYRLVINANEEALRNAQAFERRQGSDEMASAGGDTQTDAQAQAGSDQGGQDQMAKEGDVERTFDRPEVERDGYRAARTDEITADNLVGTDVYSSETDEDIGDVDRLVLNDDGRIKHAVVDVGGFLGLGEHVIAVQPEEMRIMRSENTDEMRVYLDATQAELEERPEYQG